MNMKLNRLYFLLVVLLLGHTNLYAQVQESMYGEITCFRMRKP